MNHKRFFTVLFLLTCCLIFSIRSLAAGENVVIRLDLSNYDSFNESVEVICQSEFGDSVRSELTSFNNHELLLNLEPDSAYEISLGVIGDDLHLIDLSPMRFPVQVKSDTVQTFTIGVRDSAGMEAENGSHKDFLYEEEDADEPKEPARYDSSANAEKTGTLTVTGPDIAGVKSIFYTLQDKDGKFYQYALKKEHNFKAVIQLPFGRYSEEFDVVLVEPEEGITIPEDISFYCKYYGNKPGQFIVIDRSRPEQKNAAHMQLWVNRRSGADYELLNMYQFSVEESVCEITGHADTIAEAVTSEALETEEITTEEVGETETQKDGIEDFKHKAGWSWMMIPIAAAVLISVIIGWRKWRNGK